MICRIHDAHHHPLAAHDGKHSCAHIDGTPAAQIANLAVLRTIPLCRINSCHHLQPCNNDRRKRCRKQDGMLPQDSINTNADAKSAVHRLKVNVRRFLIKGCIQDNIDKGQDVTAAAFPIGSAMPHLTCSIQHQALHSFRLHADCPLSITASSAARSLPRGDTIHKPVP